MNHLTLELIIFYRITPVCAREFKYKGHRILQLISTKLSFERRIQCFINFRDA